MDLTLSTPPALNLSEAKDFAGCSFVFFNATSFFQTPSSFGYNDFSNFSCDTVMTSQRQADVQQQVFDELEETLNLGKYDLVDSCYIVETLLKVRQVPSSCQMSSKELTWGEIQYACKHYHYCCIGG